MDSGHSNFKFRASRGRVFSTCFDTSILTHNRLTLTESPASRQGGAPSPIKGEGNMDEGTPL
jgi:hypothetical protein